MTDLAVKNLMKRLLARSSYKSYLSEHTAQCVREPVSSSCYREEEFKAPTNTLGRGRSAVARPPSIDRVGLRLILDGVVNETSGFQTSGDLASERE